MPGRFYSLSPKGKPAPLPSLDSALQAMKQAVVWMDFEAPSREELLLLQEPLGIHPLSIEDCLDEDQIPKVEEHPTNTFMLLNTWRMVDRRLEIDEVDLILGKGFLVTIHRSAALTEELSRVVLSGAPNAGRSADFLLHALLDRIVDDKLGVIEALQDHIDQAEEEILSDLSRFGPERLMSLRRDLLSLRKGLFHEREIFVKICRKDSAFISDKAIPHFRDIYDHVVRYYEIVEIGREMLGTLMETYLSMMNNEMARTANRTNQVVQRLTLITTVFMPLTLLASIGGMSEWSMITGPENWRISYPLFLAGMGLLALLSFRLLRWVDRKGDERRER